MFYSLTVTEIFEVLWQFCAKKGLLLWCRRVFLKLFFPGFGVKLLICVLYEVPPEGKRSPRALAHI